MTPIGDLAYVAAVLTLYVDLPDTPLRASPQDDGYLQYLRLKLRNAIKALPADVQKNTFSEDR